jgi:hypothetical protein
MPPHWVSLSGTQELSLCRIAEGYFDQEFTLEGGGRK